MKQNLDIFRQALLKKDKSPQSQRLLALSGFMLSACGGGGGGGDEPSPTKPTISGRVVDGYISNARVFFDENKNGQFDPSEKYALTDNNGYFSGLSTTDDSVILVDNNRGSAIDTATGFPLGFSMSAPVGYTVITPVTSLVAGLVENGQSKESAEKIVKTVLGLSDSFRLDNFDPIPGLIDPSASLAERNLAQEYQLTSMQIANIMLLRDGDFSNTAESDFQEFIKHLADIAFEKYNSETTLNLANVQDLSDILPSLDQTDLESLVSLNSQSSYYDALDAQLINLASNPNGNLIIDNSTSFYYIAVQIDGALSAEQAYAVTLSNSTGSISVVSDDVISIGGSVVVFKFEAEQLNDIASFLRKATVTNNTTGETFEALDELTVTIETSDEDTNGSEPEEPIVIEAGGDDEEDDGGDGEEEEVIIITDSGVVADGYISGARVFRDENKNGSYDAGEEFKITNASGEFSELAGDSTKPIVVDGNNGQAVDTSTGITFNSILSAPAGSKVVNPITTIVHELMLDDATLDVSAANLSVAKAMGLTNVVDGSGTQVDFTKFDPIANEILGGDTPVAIDANLATVTQGVATYVANLIVSGANEKGGDVSTVAATTKSIITNLKNAVKTKATAVDAGDASAVFNFTDNDDILLALGDDFNASSSTLEKLKEEYDGFDTSNPAVTAANFDNDKLIEKQLVAQSEFGDRVLTDTEAANGALLVVGPTFDPSDPGSALAVNGTATVKITNETTGKVLFTTANFANSKYASVELSAAQLNDQIGQNGGGTLKVEVKLGSLSSSTWDTSSAEVIFTTGSEPIYYHKGIEPVITFDASKVIVNIANGNALVTSSDTENLQILGTVQIDLGASQLPNDITLAHLVDGLNDNFDDGTGREVILEFIDSDGEIVFATNAEVEPVTDAVNGSANTGLATFVWSKTFTESLESSYNIAGTFGDLSDGNYSIKASFTDSYGASSIETFENVIINRVPPKISTLSIVDQSVNISDETVVFKLGFNEAIASFDAGKIKLNINGTASALNSDLLSDSVAASLNSDSTELTIQYSPTGAGSVYLFVESLAFTDEAGNDYSAPLSSDSNYIDFSAYPVSYDLDAPSVASISIQNSTDSDITALNSQTSDGNLKVKLTFSEKVESLTLSDLSISKINGVRAAELSNLVTSDDPLSDEYKKIWYADLTPTTELEGNFSISVLGNSYTDLLGNLGSSLSKTEVALDTRVASPFQVALVDEQAEYEETDTIKINVVFDAALASNTDALNSADNKPKISLDIGEHTRFAELSSVNGSTATFSYTVGNSDLSDDNGVIVSDIITGSELYGADGNQVDTNIGSVSEPLNLSGKSVNGGTSGSTVDGYVEGGVIYADNDLDDGLSIVEIDGTPLEAVNTTTTYTYYELSAELHGVSGDGNYVVAGNDETGWSAYLLSGNGTDEAFSLSDIADASQVTLDQSTIDGLIATQAAVVRIETVYNMSAETHGVSVDGSYVLRGSDEDGWVAYQVTGIASPYETNATPDNGDLQITSLIDIEGGAGLTEGDSIAQSDSTGGFTIYGANGPLVLEGGFDISTNKEFSVRYKAPGDYTVINPVSTLVVAGTNTNTNTIQSAEIVFDEIFSQYEGSTSEVTTQVTSADFSSYNAYEKIAQAADLAIATDGGNTDDVKQVVQDALIYQKAAASYALVVDFLSTATFAALGSPSNTSISKISDDVFEIISASLGELTRTFANKSFSELYSGDNVADYTSDIAPIAAQLKLMFGDLNGLNELFENIDEDDLYDLLAASIVAINQADTAFDYDSVSIETDDIIEAAEDGINALTEIVQVQAVVQSNILSEVVNFLDNTDTAQAPTNVNPLGLLGSSLEDGYLSEPVGTVVPIRYDLTTKDGEALIKFEGNSDGSANQFEFVVSRSGSIKTTSSLDYSITGGVSSADISGGVLSGTLFFDVNEKQKTLNIALNNDTLREASETLTVVISDPTEMSQIVNDRASVTIKDDDPSTPELNVPRDQYNMAEGGTEYLDEVSFDYFDSSAFFRLSWVEDGGSLSTKIGSTAYTGTDFISFYDMQTSVLRNLEFTADGQSENSTSANVIFSLTSSENADGSGRSANAEFEISFDVQRLPSLDISNLSFNANTQFAGIETEISGVTVSDPDSEFLIVTINSDLAGELYSVSTANYTFSELSSQSVSFSGTQTNIQDALDNLRFVANEAGNLTLSFSVDDSDQLHERNTDGTLSSSGASATDSTPREIAASSSVVNQVFEPYIKVGSGFWSGVSGIEVSDPDSETVTVNVSATTGNEDKVSFRLYDASNTTNPVLQEKSSNIEISGTPGYVTDRLKLLQVELTENAPNLFQIEVDDADEGSAETTPFIPSYVAMFNAVPDPGGNLTSNQILEDEGAQQIVISGIRLFDSDAIDDNGNAITPTFVRVISSNGGTVYTSSGSSVSNENGTPIDLGVSSQGSITLRFEPDADFVGQAIIKYVVVDPQQGTFISPISEIRVDVAQVNDTPTVKLSSLPVHYTQNQDPQTVFSDTVIEDIDSNLFTAIEIEADLDYASGEEVLIAPDEILGMTKTVDGSKIVYSGAEVSALNVSSILSNIKFQTNSNNLVNQSREFSVSVTDKEGSESLSVSKTVILDDVNDAPIIEGGLNVQNYLEGGAAININLFGSILDPEENNIREIKIHYESGYKLGQDFLTLDADFDTIEVEFDEASGALILSAVNPDVGISASNFNEILASVSYHNTNENPADGSVKELYFELTDVYGQSGVSGGKSIVLSAQNDEPEVFSLRAGQEVSSINAGQFVSGSNGIRVAPNVTLRDVDSNEFKSATISVASSETANTASLRLSSSGEQLKTAFNLTVEITPSANASDGPSLKIYKGSLDDDQMVARATLEKIVREIVYENSGQVIGGKADNIEIIATDREGLDSETYTSIIKLLDTPPVEVKPFTFTEGSDFATSLGGASGIVNVLTFNADAIDPEIKLFEVGQLYVDLSTSSMRIDGSRYKYDPSITADRIALNKAGHIDLTHLGGIQNSTEVSVLGQTSANVILGSQFADYIDGNAGKDVIRALDGDDTVVLRLDAPGAIFDGGNNGSEGDTLIMPKSIAGTIDLSSSDINFTTFADGETTVVSGVAAVNFENIDARAATENLILKGTSESNLYLSGSGDDEIWIAGNDTAFGGLGSDLFVIDLTSNTGSSREILDLSPADKVKFYDGSNYLDASAITWLYKQEDIDAASSNSVIESWVSFSISEGYQLKIDDADGAVTNINIGTDIFGSLGKWTLDDGSGHFVLQPEANTVPNFVSTGPITSENRPTSLVEQDGVFAFEFSGVGNTISFEDQDDDQIHLSVSYEGIELKAGGILYPEQTTVDSVENINSLLSSLSVTGDSRGDGTLTLTLTDDFSTPISKTYYFEIPNSLPSISSDFDTASLPKTEIGEEMSLSIAELGIEFNDPDIVDNAEQLLSLDVKFQGGTANYAGNYQQFVTISGSNITIAHDGVTTIPSETTWDVLLADIFSEISFSRQTVGIVEVQVTVNDLEGSSEPTTLQFEFEPKPISKPELLTTANEPVEGEIYQLNGAQFESGKIRVFVQETGARVGDEIKVTATVGEQEQDSVIKTIPASATNMGVVTSFVEFKLNELVSSEEYDGTFTIHAELLIDDVAVSSTDMTDLVTFSLDTHAPLTSTILNLNGDDALGFITNSNVDKIIVTDADGEVGLAHSVVKLLDGNSQNWYDLNPEFDLLSLLTGTGRFNGEISLDSEYNDETGHYSLSLANVSLQNGVYAVISRDAVGNISPISLSGFDYKNDVLPDAIFVVDRTLQQSDIGYDILNAQSIPGVDYRYYKLGSDQAAAIEIGVKPEAIGSFLPKDIVGLSVAVWKSASDTGSSNAEADVTAEFTRNLAVEENHWEKVSGDEYVTVSGSKSQELNPVIVLDLESGLSGVSGYVGIRISITDIAGNTIFIDTPSDQIELDLIADEGSPNEVNGGYVTSVVSDELYTGISKSEATEFEFSLSGLDADAYARSSYVLSYEQVISNLKSIEDGEPFVPTLEELLGLELDEGHHVIEGAKLPSFNEQSVYLDVEAAFLNSLSLEGTSTPPVALGSALDWKLIGFSDGVSQYVSHSDYDTFIRGSEEERSAVDVYTSNFVMDTHISGDVGTKISSVSQNISAILHEEGAEDKPLFILNQVFDLAGNTSFRSDILGQATLNDDATGVLRVDVKDPLIEEFSISIGDDSGEFSNDLVTNVVTPQFIFRADEEISSARIIQISRLSDVDNAEIPLEAYELEITPLESEELGYNYSASLSLQNTELSHGLWGLELTDIAGNTLLADASSLNIDGTYNTNVDFAGELMGLMVVDTLVPPPADIEIVGVEESSGYLNQYETNTSVNITILPGYDENSAEELRDNQITKILDVTLNGVSVEEVEAFEYTPTGAQVFTFNAEELEQGLHIVNVVTQDIAGNVVDTAYEFVKDTISIAEPLLDLSIDMADDGVLNRDEIGYGTDGSDIGINISLSDPLGSKIVSVKVDDFEVEGVPFYVLSENQFGIHAAGAYIINYSEETSTFEGYSVIGDGTGLNPFEVGDEAFDFVNMDQLSFDGLTEPSRENYVPISAIDVINNPSLVGVYKFNAIDVIAPSAEHHDTHTLTVTIADLAGNLTTETLEFQVDTKLADVPDIYIERANTADNQLVLLDYWDTQQTNSDLSGIRIQFAEKDSGDFMDASSLKINGEQIDEVTYENDIYFINFDDLLDAEGGAVANVLSGEVIDASGNRTYFETEFQTYLDQPVDQYFELVPTVFTTDENSAESLIKYHLYLDVFVADQGLLELSENPFGGTAIDIKLAPYDRNISFDGEILTSATLSSAEIFESEVFIDEPNATLRWSGYSEEKITSIDGPIFRAEFEVDSYEDLLKLQTEAVFTISKINEQVVTQEMDVFDLSYAVQIENLILADQDYLI